jgi:acyl carrier protein
MTSTPNDEELLDLIAKEALVERSKLRPDVPIADVGIESLDVISILFEVEDKYGVQVDEKDIGGCVTLGDLIGLLRTRVGAPA